MLCLLAGLAASPAAAKDIVAPARGGVVVGTNKADRITASGGGVHTIRCRAGRDIVTADPGDTVAPDCEVVSLQVSRDPYRNASSQHQTQVEPDSFGFGSTEVTTFQSGRFVDGGASNIGWATTTDAGLTWKSGFLPGLTMFGAPPGFYPRASDPVVTYDARHGVWMIVSLAFSPTADAFLISRSADGRGWDMPVTAWESDHDLDFDKPWISCDNWQASPYFGNCYLTWADFGTGELVTQTSRDGGLTWSAPVPSPAFGNDSFNGMQPVVLPNGTLVNLFSGRTTLAETISTDGGTTFTSAIHHRPAGLPRRPAHPQLAFPFRRGRRGRTHIRRVERLRDAKVVQRRRRRLHLLRRRADLDEAATGAHGRHRARSYVLHPGARRGPGARRTHRGRLLRHEGV